MTRCLYVVVCGAGPAGDVDRLIREAQEQDWAVQLISTPAGLDFIDLEALEELTGNVVRAEYRKPGQPRSAPADAIIVAPATYNTINKLAAGISDTYALGVVGEAIGLGLPVMVLPFVNTALANREPFKRSVDSLRAEGVEVLMGPGQWEPHEPHTGGQYFDSFPWTLALDRVMADLDDTGD
ncbi:MAG: flavoprotein [Actinomycetota bacterium]